jgi:hypothetical protein
MLHAVNYFCGSSRFRVTRLRGIRACAPSPVAGSATYAGRNGRASRPRTPRVEGCTQRACCSPNARRAIWPAFPKAPARKQLFSFASRKCQTCPMLTSHAWNGPTFRELRAEGVLLSANEERRHWSISSGGKALLSAAGSGKDRGLAHLCEPAVIFPIFYRGPITRLYALLSVVACTPSMPHNGA